MDCSTPGLPVHHQLPELAQTHIYCVSDAIQPSQPPSPPAFNLSQHESLFKWVSSSHQVAKVLELQLLPQSFQWIFRIDFLRMDWLDLLAVSKESSAAPQFKSVNSWVLSFLYSPTLTSIHDHWKNQALTRWTFVGRVMPLLFNMLSRFAIAFLPRSKCLLTVRSDFGAQENTVCHCFHCFSIYLLIIYFIIRMACLHTYNKMYFYWNS